MPTCMSVSVHTGRKPQTVPSARHGLTNSGTDGPSLSCPLESPGSAVPQPGLQRPLGCREHCGEALPPSVLGPWGSLPLIMAASWLTPHSRRAHN